MGYTVSNNRLLTERKGRTGEYWPEGVAVWTERSKVRTATTEGQSTTLDVTDGRLLWRDPLDRTSMPLNRTSIILSLVTSHWFIPLWHFTFTVGLRIPWD